MSMKKKLDCTIRLVPVESLKKYHKPEEINGHCKNCPRYGLNWLCPPHDFNVMDYVERYNMAYVIGVKVSLLDFSEKADSLNYYYECRLSINRRLLQYEGEISGSVVLIGGHCDLCENCTRQVSTECRYPEKQRYSLESLGFKVSGIVEDFIGDKLQWENGKTPKSLYVVLGILSNEVLNANKLREVLIGNNGNN